MEKQKILVVDDEARMRKLVNDFLTKAGYAVIEAADGMQALEIFSSEKGIDLILLDVMMPGLDGWDTLKSIRELSSVPVVMLTARGAEQDELRGFRLGVDEYINKPFSPRVLVARVDALLRRASSGRSELLEAGGITVDRAARTVTVDGSAVDLSFKEFELLVYFMENRGIALSRETILGSVWNYDFFGDSRTIDTHVKKLRGKLGAKGDLIRTVWGMGYKFEV